MNRILIIGLDGASPDLITKWQSDLPNLNRLIIGGAFGTLKSVIPPRSIPAWYCFATGMNPAKLDVFGFSQRRPGTYDYTFANFTFCQAPPFWKWLNEENILTAIIHLPGTFPPRPLKGFMVSGWPGPLNRGNLTYTYPPELSREVDTFLKRPFELVSPKSIQPDNDEEMLTERLRILEMHAQTAIQLLQAHPWQVGVVILSPLDRASHQFWRHMDLTHPQHEPALAEKFGDALKQVYQASDIQIGRLLNLVDENDWVFIVSDHGFGPVHQTFYLNEWLRQQGYLILKEGVKTKFTSIPKKVLGKLSTPLFKLNDTSPAFRKMIGPFKKRAFSNLIRNSFVQMKEDGLVRLNHLPIDWENTKAYCPDESSLYLNIRGRDPQGCVSYDEVEALLAEIEHDLNQLRHPETGASISVHAQRKEIIYDGPFLNEAPEIIIEMDNYKTEVMAELAYYRLWDSSPVRSGNHTPNGVLIAIGPGISGGTKVNAGLMDIAPTILHMLGTAVPEAVDGKICFELFDKNHEISQREVKWSSAIYDEVKPETFTAEEQAQIEKQLRDLGYLN